jgi:hypothetical protein
MCTGTLAQFAYSTTLTRSMVVPQSVVRCCLNGNSKFALTSMCTYALLFLTLLLQTQVQRLLVAQDDLDATMGNINGNQQELDQTLEQLETQVT